MPELTANLGLLTPEFALAGLAFLVFAVDLVLPDDRKHLLAWLSIAGLVGLMALSAVMLWGEQESLYDGLLAIDDYSLFFKIFFMGIGVFIILSSVDYVKAVPDKSWGVLRPSAVFHPRHERDGPVAGTLDRLHLSGVVELLPLCAGFVRPEQSSIERGRIEVHYHRRILLSHSAVRHQHGVQHYRSDSVRRYKYRADERRGT